MAKQKVIPVDPSKLDYIAIEPLHERQQQEKEEAWGKRLKEWLCELNQVDKIIVLCLQAEYTSIEIARILHLTESCISKKKKGLQVQYNKFFGTNF